MGAPSLRPKTMSGKSIVYNPVNTQQSRLLSRKLIAEYNNSGISLKEKIRQQHICFYEAILKLVRVELEYMFYNEPANYAAQMNSDRDYIALTTNRVQLIRTAFGEDQKDENGDYLVSSEDLKSRLHTIGVYIQRFMQKDLRFITYKYNQTRGVVNNDGSGRIINQKVDPKGRGNFILCISKKFIVFERTHRAKCYEKAQKFIKSKKADNQHFTKDNTTTCKVSKDFLLENNSTNTENGDPTDQNDIKDNLSLVVNEENTNKLSSAAGRRNENRHHYLQQYRRTLPKNKQIDRLAFDLTYETLLNLYLDQKQSDYHIEIAFYNFREHLNRLAYRDHEPHASIDFEPYFQEIKKAISIATQYYKKSIDKGQPYRLLTINKWNSLEIHEHDGSYTSNNQKIEYKKGSFAYPNGLVRVIDEWIPRENQLRKAWMAKNKKTACLKTVRQRIDTYVNKLETASSSKSDKELNMLMQKYYHRLYLYLEPIPTINQEQKYYFMEDYKNRTILYQK